MKVYEFQVLPMFLVRLIHVSSFAPKEKNIEEDILKGMYKFKEFNKNKKTKIQLLGSGGRD